MTTESVEIYCPNDPSADSEGIVTIDITGWDTTKYLDMVCLTTCTWDEAWRRLEWDVSDEAYDAIMSADGQDDTTWRWRLIEALATQRKERATEYLLSFVTDTTNN